MSKANPIEAGDGAPGYVKRLEAVERAVDFPTADRAAKILERWFNGSDDGGGIEGVTLFRRDEKQLCRDCERREYLYVWDEVLPSNICAECSLSRFKNGGRNMRPDADPDSTGSRRRRRGR